MAAMARVLAQQASPVAYTNYGDVLADIDPVLFAFIGCGLASLSLERRRQLAPSQPPEHVSDELVAVESKECTGGDDELET